MAVLLCYSPAEAGGISESQTNHQQIVKVSKELYYKASGAEQRLSQEWEVYAGVRSDLERFRREGRHPNDAAYVARRGQLDEYRALEALAGQKTVLGKLVQDLESHPTWGRSEILDQRKATFEQRLREKARALTLPRGSDSRAAADAKVAELTHALHGLDQVLGQVSHSQLARFAVSIEVPHSAEIQAD